MLGFILFLIWALSLTSTIALGCWAYYNAQIRGVKNPGVWGVIVAAAPLFTGWIAYMIYRVVKSPKREEPEVQDAADWANFEQPIQKPVVDTTEPDVAKLKGYTGKCALIFAISFVLCLIMWCVFLYLFITGLAAVLVSSLGAISAGISDITSQIPSIGG